MSLLRCNTAFLQKNPRYSTLIADSLLHSTDIDTLRKKDFADMEYKKEVSCHKSFKERTETSTLFIFKSRHISIYFSHISYYRSWPRIRRNERCLSGWGREFLYWIIILMVHRMARLCEVQNSKILIKYYYSVQSTLLSINLLEYIAKVLFSPNQILLSLFILITPKLFLGQKRQRLLPKREIPVFISLLPFSSTTYPLVYLQN